METKLKSVLTNPISLLLFKSALVGLVLAWSPVAAAAVAIWFYFRPLFYSFNYLPLFMVWLAMAFWLPSHWLAAVFLSFLFFILLGIKDLLFVAQKLWRLILAISLFYLVFLNFFLIDKSSLFTMKWLTAILIVFLLINDVFKSFLSEFNRPLGVVSLTATLIIGEMLWVASWLPLGFLNAANLMTLITFLLADLIIHYYQGALNKRLVIKDSVLFFVLFLFILVTSQWTI